MAIIAKYKFNSSTYADYLPTFNSEFTGYRKTDVNNGDGTITRTISHDALKPTVMRFGATSGVTDREKSLLEVMECDTSEVTNMGNMFSGCSSLTSLDVSNFNTSKVTDMGYMFNACKLLTSLDLSNFDTGKVTNMNSIFENCNSLTSLNISSWITSKVTDMAYMFNQCYVLTSLDVSSFNTSQVTNMSKMFSGCSKLTSLDLSNFDTNKVTGMNSMFENCQALTSLNISGWNTSKVTDMTSMFKNCKLLSSLNLSNFNTGSVTGMGETFNGCSSLTSLDISSFDTSQVNSMNNMFYNCKSLTSLDLSNFNTSNVVRMANMFDGCSSLTSLDLSNWDTSNVINMIGMFYGCSSLISLNLSNFDTSKVVNMDSMFKDCSSLTSLDLSSFNTNKVENMSNMFAGCSKLTSLNVSTFNTSKVTTMNQMFNGCSSLTSLDLSNFNTNSVINMQNMFSSCKSLTCLDLSSFSTNNVTTMASMFNGCISLTYLDLSNFNISQTTNIVSMFNACPVSSIGLLYTTSTTINGLLTELGTSVARNIYYTDAPLDELAVQNNITYKKYELTQATFPYTLNKLPNGVADYIDVVNKVHVQRVQSIVLDGTEIWIKQHYINGYTLFMNRVANEPTDTAIRVNGMICDKFNVENYDNLQAQTREFITLRHGGTKMFLLNVSNDKASEVATLQTYLASNPIKVLYPLATPIYTPLTEEEIAQLPLSAYADGYVNLSSDQLMPSFEFRMRASNRYQVDMLETGYYYLNAPVGNVKLGTANVDVQQMPCIIKVDNVGTGDSGYRLGLSDGAYYMDLSLDYEEGILNVSTGDVVTDGSGRWASDFIEVPYYNKKIYIANKCSGIDIVYYDENKNFINGVALGNSTQHQLTGNTSAKYMRFSGKSDDMIIQLRELPITLSKLPSHRIPTTFTQGMKCGTDFGYWEGIKGARPSLFKTVDRATWNNIEVSEIENGSGVVLNRIEYDSTIVEDELDIATGKLIKRIGKVVLDGSNDCLKESFTADNQVFQRYIIRVDAPHKNDCLGLTNYLPFLPSKDKYGVDYVRARGTNEFWLYQKEDLSTEEVRKRLAGNPITVYYELAVPEISYILLSANQVKTVANTALQCAHHNNYLNPQTKPSHLTYPVPSLVGNRTYTVVHNRKNITGSTKPIELNLGGTVVQLNDASSKTLVKTPSTLTHSNLIFIGGESTVDHIMVLDGDWTNKPIEYFENMMGHDTDAIITIIGDGKIDDVAEQYLW